MLFKTVIILTKNKTTFPVVSNPATKLILSGVHQTVCGPPPAGPDLRNAHLPQERDLTQTKA